MSGGDIGLEVLVPLGVLLGILVVIFLYLVCKYYLCERVQETNDARSKYNDYKYPGVIKSPSFAPSVKTHIVQMRQDEQFTNFQPTLQVPRRKHGNSLLPVDDIFDKKIYMTEELNSRSTRRSEASLSDATILSDYSDNSSEVSAQRKPSSTQSDRSHRRYERHKRKKRKTSEPASRSRSSSAGAAYRKLSAGVTSRKSSTGVTSRKLSADPGTEYVNEFTSLTRERSQSAIQLRKESKAVQIDMPAGGQLELLIFYNSEEKNLEITILQLLDISLEAKSFIGILDVYDACDKPPKSDKAYLKWNEHGELEMINKAELGFFVYVMLLPRKSFRRYTNAVFGHSSIVFNEKITITGYSLDYLNSLSLCFHALCKFGRDGEPIVLGEVKIPLSSINAGKMSTFMPYLNMPQEKLELDSNLTTTTDLGFLEIYLWYNPMSQKLTVTILKARGLPKYKLAGQPNISIKLGLHYCSDRIERHKTKQYPQRHPDFNETFSFDIVREKLPEYDILFEVRYHGAMIRKPIGYVAVGNSSGSEGKQHWLQLLDFSHHTKVHKIMPFKPVNLL